MRARVYLKVLEDDALDQSDVIFFHEPFFGGTLEIFRLTIRELKTTQQTQRVRLRCAQQQPCSCRWLCAASRARQTSLRSFFSFFFRGFRVRATYRR